MKRTYLSPEVSLYEVMAEQGYQASAEGPGFGIPGYGSESDELI